MSNSVSTTPPASDVPFSTFNLSPELLRDLTRAGFQVPTPIQCLAIPPGLEGRDVLGCAQTGTGKTAAFAIPMIERLGGSPPGRARGLILAPTRELAIQIQSTIDRLGRGRRVYATTIVGGMDMQMQVRALRQRPEIIVATPGRLLDHMWNGTIDMSGFEIVVLDEADRMLDMGFAPQLNQILDALPEVRQTLLFSATMPDDLASLARASVKNPVRATVGKSATPAEGVTQVLHHTTQADKTPLLLSLLREREGSVLVFTRTKHRADRVGRTLEQAGHRVAVLHGDRGLSQRRRALEGFRRGQYRVLVATDIAARGIDVADIGHVINYDLPNCPEDYVHRIGRTARMKAVGQATTFATAEDAAQVRAIERLLGRAVPRVVGTRHGADPRPHRAPEQSRPEAGPPPRSEGQVLPFRSRRRRSRRPSPFPR